MLLLFAVGVQVVSGTEVCESTIGCALGDPFTGPDGVCLVNSSITDVFYQCEDTATNEVCHQLFASQTVNVGTVCVELIAPDDATNDLCFKVTYDVSSSGIYFSVQ